MTVQQEKREPQKTSSLPTIKLNTKPKNTKTRNQTIKKNVSSNISPTTTSTQTPMPTPTTQNKQTQLEESRQEEPKNEENELLLNEGFFDKKEEKNSEKSEISYEIEGKKENDKVLLLITFIGLTFSFISLSLIALKKRKINNKN